MEAPGVLFDRKEKYDEQFSVRAPKSLKTRVAKIATAQEQSENEARVRLMSLGVDVFEWMSKHLDRLDGVRRAEGMLPEELITKVLDAGLAAFEAKASKK